jgi:hypothetical protein
MKPFVALLFSLLFSGAAFSQTEDYYRPDYPREPDKDLHFKPGLYLSHLDFKRNAPSVPAESLVSGFGEVYSRDRVRYDSLGRVVTLRTDSIWAYSDGRRLFVRVSRLAQSMEKNLENKYARRRWLREKRWAEFDIIGSICLLTMVKNDPYVVNPAGQPMSVSTPLQAGSTFLSTGTTDMGLGPYFNRAREKQFMLDLSTGELSLFILDNVLKVVQKDPEFNRKNRPPYWSHYKQKFFYLFAYNEKHPIYFPQ